MSIDQDIVNSARTLEADVRLTHDIVHGSDTTEVMTNGGPVPSHAKLARDSLDAIAHKLEPSVKTINDHAQLVMDSATAARDSEEAAKVSEGKAGDSAVAAKASEDSLTAAALDLTSIVLHAGTIALHTINHKDYTL